MEQCSNTPRTPARFLVAFLCLMLAGCATNNQPGTSTYEPVPASQIMGTIPRPASGAAAVVIVKRDAGFTGAALSSILTVDGRAIARLRSGQFISLRIAPGDHLFGVASSDNLGPVATNISREVSADCQVGKTYYFRLFPQVANGIAIDRVSQ